MSVIPQTLRASEGLGTPWTLSDSALDPLGTICGPQTPCLLTPPLTTNYVSVPGNGLLNLLNELEKKNSHIFICNGKSWNIKDYFQLVFNIKGYSNTSTGFIGGFTIQIMHSAP